MVYRAGKPVVFFNTTKNTMCSTEYINCPDTGQYQAATAIWTAITGFGCAADTASLLLDTQTGEVHQMSNELKSSITSIEQVDNNHFFMGTDKGLRYVYKLENETLQIVPLANLLTNPGPNQFTLFPPRITKTFDRYF